MVISRQDKNISNFLKIRDFTKRLPERNDAIVNKEELVRMVAALTPEQKKLMIDLLQDLVDKQSHDPDWKE